eukprot:jgi/Galph1/5080/GphlegSOOS_G3714.1
MHNSQESKPTNQFTAFQPNEQALESILSGTGISLSYVTDGKEKLSRLTDSKLPIPRRITLARKPSLSYPQRKRIGQELEENLEKEKNIQDNDPKNCFENISKKQLKGNMQVTNKYSEQDENETQQANSQLVDDSQGSSKASVRQRNKANSQRRPVKIKERNKENVTKEGIPNNFPKSAFLDFKLLDEMAAKIFNSDAMTNTSDDWQYICKMIWQLIMLHENDESRIKELEHENVLLLNRITNCERDAASERESMKKEFQDMQTQLSSKGIEIRTLQEQLREQKQLLKETTEQMKSKIHQLEKRLVDGNINRMGSSEQVEQEMQEVYSRRKQFDKTQHGEESKVSVTSHETECEDVSRQIPRTSSVSAQSSVHSSYTDGGDKCLQGMTTQNTENSEKETSSNPKPNSSTIHAYGSSERLTPSSNTSGRVVGTQGYYIKETSFYADSSKFPFENNPPERHPSQDSINHEIERSNATFFEIQPQSLQQILSSENPSSIQTSRDASRFMSFYEPGNKQQTIGMKDLLRDRDETPEWRRLTLTAATSKKYSLTNESGKNADSKENWQVTTLFAKLVEEIHGPRYRNMRDAWQNFFKPACNRLKPSLFYQAVRKIPACRQVSQANLEELFQTIVPIAKETPKEQWEEKIAMGWEHFVRLYQGSLLKNNSS